MPETHFLVQNQTKQNETTPVVGNLIEEVIHDKQRMAAIQKTAEEMGVNVTVIAQRAKDAKETVAYQHHGSDGGMQTDYLGQGDSFIHIEFPAKLKANSSPFWRQVEKVQTQAQT